MKDTVRRKICLVVGVDFSTSHVGIKPASSGNLPAIVITSAKTR